MPITELRIEGLRTIERARLALDCLTVLIGENGSGKSSIIEACEILRRATGERFLDELYGIHGGLSALLRQGAPKLSLGVTVRPTRGELSEAEINPDLFELVEWAHYELSLTPSGPFGSIEESLKVAPGPSWAKLRPEARKATKRKAPSGAPGPETVTILSRLGPQINVWPGRRLRNIEPSTPYLGQVDYRSYTEELVDGLSQIIGLYLRKIQVHLPFEVMPAWAARSLDRKSALRTPSLFAPATSLDKLGLNLANAYHALKNSFGPDAWRRTLDYVRLGLGERIEDVATWADPGGGAIGLALKESGLDRPVPAAQLADGVLSYLAFVALFRLRSPVPSLLAMDEPDLHLHPRLLMRVLDMLESMAAEHPVLVATHSDRLLDGLSDPARAAVLCELDSQGRTRLLRPDAAALARWLERYRGLGEIRGAGHEASIFTRSEPTG